MTLVSKRKKEKKKYIYIAFSKYIHMLNMRIYINTYTPFHEKKNMKNIQRTEGETCFYGKKDLNLYIFGRSKFDS